MERKERFGAGKGMTQKFEVEDREQGVYDDHNQKTKITSGRHHGRISTECQAISIMVTKLIADKMG